MKGLKATVIYMAFALHATLGFGNVIAIEGMAGAGKTTVLLRLAYEYEGACLLLPELNPEPDAPWGNDPLDIKGAMFHKLWLERVEAMNAFENRGLCLLLDRSYLSNLAFIYGVDTLLGTNAYPQAKQRLMSDFASDFSSLIVLDVSSETCLARRALAGDRIPWPWSEPVFLEALRDFYKTEVPQITSGPIIYIETDSLTEEQVYAKVSAEVVKNTAMEKCLHMQVTEQEEAELLAFGKRYALGATHTPAMHVLGYPTIYFRKFCVQLDGGVPVFLNTERIRALASLEKEVYAN